MRPLLFEHVYELPLITDVWSLLWGYFEELLCLMVPVVAAAT